ncbi:MAG: DUF2062 domain-containing protein [Thermodesulfobacteriota bacterium]
MAAYQLKNSALGRLYRRVRLFYLRLLLVPDTPRRVAIGLAVGVFSAFMPFLPIQTIVAVALAYLLRGSLVVAAMGTWITNPLTAAPFYATYFFIGRFLTPFGRNCRLPEVWNLDAVMGIGLDTALAIYIGGLILGLIAAPPTYFLTYRYIAALQAWERRKLRQRLDLSPPSLDETGLVGP